MSFRRSAIERLSSALIGVSLDRGTLEKATPHEFEITGGSTTTIVSTALSGAAAYDYIGNWVEIDLATGTPIARNVWRRIKAFVPGTDTATLDAALPIDPTGSFCRMWLPAESLVRARSAAASVVTVDADAAVGGGGEDARDEAAEFWSDDSSAGTLAPDRWFLHGRGGSNEDLASRIANDAAVGASEKVFTVEGTTNWSTGAAGDYYAIRKAIRVMGGSLAQPDLTRAFVERQFARGAGAGGRRSRGVVPGHIAPGDLSLELELDPAAAAASSGTVARGPVNAHDLLTAILSARSNGSSTVASTGANTVVVAGGHGTRFNAGDAALINGMVVPIESISTDTLGYWTTHPLEDVAPPASTAVYGMICYRPRTSGFTPLIYEDFPGDVHYRYVGGWLPNLTIDFDLAGGIVKLGLAGPYDHYMAYDYALPTQETDNAGRWPEGAQNSPLLTRAHRAWIGPARWGESGGVGGGDYSDDLATTAVMSDLPGLRTCKIDLGYQFARRDSQTGAQGGDGIDYIDRKTTGVMTVWGDTADWVQRFDVGSLFALQIQVGNSTRGVASVIMPACQITKSPNQAAFDGGRSGYEIAFDVVDPEDTVTDSAGTRAMDDFVLALG